MMEGWSAVAWVLLIMNMVHRLKSVQCRDFTIQDIILLHPSTTPHPGGFKCFTCQDAADNYRCNRWAPDVYCPKETRYCSTLHMMDKNGDSVSVTKRCATLDDCRFTGCASVREHGYQVCSSCCEGNICNMQVPRNESSAVFSFVSPLVGSGWRPPPAMLSYVIIIIINGSSAIFTAVQI